VDDPLDMGGRAAVVTGGSRGIGRAIAARLLEAGAAVLVCARHVPEELPAGGGRRAEFVEADIRDAEQVERVVRTAVERFGRLDVMVNNAGGTPWAEAATLSPRFAEQVVQLNLLAPFHFAQKANAVMQGQDAGGVIVNIASVAGMGAAPGAAPYAAAKAGVISLTKTLALEWGPKVRVNCVSVGLVRTESAHTHYGDEETQARIAAVIAAGRMADPADVADACLFLASPLARYVSGANLVVDGGGEPPAFLSAYDT
jgi:NAD(P)-dependent dehydrogenase (short-subunit alcohol dehydrogenase family)